MKLHVFNPEHDIALASGKASFTAPLAGRRLRADLDFLPFLWAEEGDWVLVDDADSALQRSRSMDVAGARVRFVTAEMLSAWRSEGLDDMEVCPWGWDKAICHQLSGMGVPSSCLPTGEALDAIRAMSHRRWAMKEVAPFLPGFREGTLPLPLYYESAERLLADYVASRQAKTVLKAPWSSSGRGVRYIEGPLSAQTEGWIRNIIRQQGGIMAECYYNKVKDFGMEFAAHRDGRVSFEGLSLFKTVNGAYTGNLLASEADKRKLLAAYVREDELDSLAKLLETLLAQRLAGRYVGPLGVDMMVVEREGRGGFLLHPCVEVNLRRTMGHVALSLTPTQGEPSGLMRIELTDRYRFHVSRKKNSWPVLRLRE